MKSNFLLNKNFQVSVNLVCRTLAVSLFLSSFASADVCSLPKDTCGSPPCDFRRIEQGSVTVEINSIPYALLPPADSCDQGEIRVDRLPFGNKVTSPGGGPSPASTGPNWFIDLQNADHLPLTTTLNYYHWVTDKDTGPTIIGLCGTPAASATPPAVGLCAAGAPDPFPLTGPGPWTWICRGGTGPGSADSGACNAAVTPTINGVCGTLPPQASMPAAGVCASGTPGPVGGIGPWTWTCLGSGPAPDPDPTCTVAVAAIPIDGICGTSTNGQTFPVAPTVGLCDSGTESPPVPNGSGWNWTCAPSGGSAVTGNCSANLSLPPIAGLCGGANGVGALSAPTSGFCNVGNFVGVTGIGPWNWSCQGSNGGPDMLCSAPVATKFCEVTQYSFAGFDPLDSGITEQILPGETTNCSNSQGYRGVVTPYNVCGCVGFGGAIGCTSTNSNPGQNNNTVTYTCF